MWDDVPISNTDLQLENLLRNPRVYPYIYYLIQWWERGRVHVCTFFLFFLPFVMARDRFLSVKDELFRGTAVVTYPIRAYPTQLDGVPGNWGLTGQPVAGMDALARYYVRVHLLGSSCNSMQYPHMYLATTWMGSSPIWDLLLLRL